MRLRKSNKERVRERKSCGKHTNKHASRIDCSEMKLFAIIHVPLSCIGQMDLLCYVVIYLYSYKLVYLHCMYTLFSIPTGFFVIVVAVSRNFKCPHCTPPFFYLGTYTFLFSSTAILHKCIEQTNNFKDCVLEFFFVGWGWTAFL